MKEVGIDLNANIAEAKTMRFGLDIMDFVSNVQIRGSWDYKKNQIWQRKYGSKFMDAFGNWHFGVVANAYGFNLETTLFGGGSYQMFFQNGKNVQGFLQAEQFMYHTLSGYLYPDYFTIQATRNGMTWGDNNGDAINSMNGWLYYGESY